MAFAFSGVAEYTEMTGTGNYTALKPVPGAIPFFGALVSGSSITYLVTDGTRIEKSQGVYNSTLKRITRVSVLYPSTGAVDWSAGRKLLMLSFEGAITFSDITGIAAPHQGGTGINNDDSDTITLAGPLVTTGTGTLTLGGNSSATRANFVSGTHTVAGLDIAQVFTADQEIDAFLGIGTAPAAQLNIAGSVSANAWTTAGIGIRVNSATYTDLTSSGTVNNTAAHNINIPTFAASSATTYTNATALRLGGPPVAGSNVTITNAWTFRVVSGNARFDGDIYDGTVAPTGTSGYVRADSPALSGTPTAPTASGGTNTTQIATTAFVTSAVSGGSGITALTGDVTATGPGSVAATLATVNSNVGSFGSSTSIPSLTVNAKGLVTAASGNVVIAPAGTLSGTTLNSSVVTSSLTSLGTITTGVWNGTIIVGQYGGTGVNNSGKTITLGGNLTTSGSFNTTLTVTGTTNSTLPVGTDTLAGLGTSQVFTANQEIDAFLGIGVSPAAQLNIGSNISANAWTTAGIGLRINSATYTDLSSSGTVTNTAVHNVNIPTFAASSATVYTNATTFRLGGPPVAGSNVTITNAWTFRVVAGNARFDGDVYDGAVAPTGTNGYVRSTSPVLVTPDIGVATASSINKVIFTAPATAATLTISNNKTFTVSNTLTLTATDGSTLAIGAGGTLGSNAYTSTAYAPLASPTFTGTVTIPTPFTLGSTSVTSTGTSLSLTAGASSLVIGTAATFGGTAPLLYASGLNGWAQARFSANTSAPVFRFGKSRGSATSAAAVAAGDRVFDITAYGDDGSTNGDFTVNNVLIRGQVIGTVSTGVVPAFVSLSTMNAAGVLGERVRFSAEGGVDIGGAGEPGVGNLSATGTLIAGTAGSSLPDQIFNQEITCTTQLDKTSNTTLANITMSSNQVLVAGKTYKVSGWFAISCGAAGGLKMALASAAISVTSMRLNARALNGTTVVSNTTVTALTSNFVAFTGVVTDVYIEGSIVVNAGGTLRIQAAQNVSDGTTTSILTGSTFSVMRIN